jgi:uncharacterized lipoprotein YajG
MKRLIWGTLTLLALTLTLAACAECPTCADLRNPTPEVNTAVSQLRLCVANVPITSADTERACAAVSVTYLLPED